jgi:hypothetical protein
MQEGRIRWLTIFLALLLVAVLGAYAYSTRDKILAWLHDEPMAWPRIVVCVMLAVLPAAICFAQTVTRKRLLRRLEAVYDLQISKTVYFAGAQKTFESIEPAGITGDYFVPIMMNMMINFLLFLLVFNGYTYDKFIQVPNAFLLGIRPDNASFNLELYQSGTFSVMAAAVLGNYVYTLAQLLNRVNNNDLFPISLHFYSARAIIAISAACIIRHTIGAFGPQGSDLILLLGFAAGLAPDLLLVALSRRAFQYLKVWGSRGDVPGTVERPTSLALLQIDDLTRDKIDRLSELGIDSAHSLARQNPFIIWAKLPYDLGLVIDWIAQAQLYVIVRDAAMAKLRHLLVTDIFDFRLRLGGASADSLLTAVGLVAADADGLRQQIDADEAFNRLLEVRAALLPGNYHIAGSSPCTADIVAAPQAGEAGLKAAA